MNNPIEKLTEAINTAQIISVNDSFQKRDKARTKTD